MNIFVACGGHDGNDKEFAKSAYELGKYIAENNHTLVFGAYYSGLMGRVYDGVIENSNDPKIKGYTLTQWEEYLKDLKLTDVKCFDKTQSKKQKFLDESDIAVYLPGGIGTLDEMFSHIASKQVNETKAKVIIFNQNHFYDDIVNMTRKLSDTGFLYEEKDDEILFANSLEEVFKFIESNNK